MRAKNAALSKMNSILKQNLDEISTMNNKLTRSALEQNQLLGMTCPICYEMKTINEFSLLNSCGHIICSEAS